MSEGEQFFDDVDSPTGEDVNVAVADMPKSDGEQDSFGSMQDRMESDDGFWRSDSEGKVVDKDGNIVIDPKTGRDFNTMEELEAFKQQAQNAAKPKTEAVKTEPKPMAKSFDAYVKGDGNVLTPEKLQELAKIGSSYKYNDDLLPKIDAAKVAAQNVPQIDPIERVRGERKNWEAIAINPIKAICEKLIANGIDQAALDALIAPDLQAQRDIVEKQYQESIEKAQLEKVEGLYKPQLSKLEQEKQTNISNANIDNLSKAYFPQGGKDQYYALINGYKDEAGNFVRGPAAQILDAFVHIATNGKQFASEQERATAYQDTHSKITADPVMSKVLFDLAYTHWLGKNAVEAKKIGFNDGRQAAQKETQRINRTIKTKPASYQAPASIEDDKDAPQLLRAAMGYSSRR